MPMAFILNRGEYDKRDDQVPPKTPAMLPAMPDDLPKNRLGLAQWLVAAGKSAHGAGDRQSLLAGNLWHWHRADGRRFRRRGRVAVASGIARLARGRFPRVGLGRETVLQA